MGCSTTNIHFDYEENYSKTGVDCEWAPRDGRLYAISSWTSSMVEITYSALVNRISMKMAIDPCKKRLNLSYIPLVVKPKRQSNILNDEDVFFI